MDSARPIRSLALTVVLLATLSISACGGDSKDSKPATGGGSTVAKADNSEELLDASIEKYFEAQVSADVEPMEAALAITAPDSIAFAYMREQIDIHNAAIDGGSPYPPSKLKKVDKTYLVCFPDDKGVETCATYSDFESEGGKLANFKIDGNDISNSLSLGTGATKKAGDLATFEYLSSFKGPVSGNVFINIRVTSGKAKINVSLFDAKYRGADKRQSTAIAANGPTELAADSMATMSMTFKAADIGGVVTILVYNDDFTREEAVTLKTR